MLATYDRSGAAATSLAFNIQLSSDKVFNYLQSGKITLTIILDSAPVDLNQVCLALLPAHAIVSDAGMCVDATGTFHK